MKQAVFSATLLVVGLAACTGEGSDAEKQALETFQTDVQQDLVLLDARTNPKGVRAQVEGLLSSAAEVNGVTIEDWDFTGQRGELRAEVQVSTNVGEAGGNDVSSAVFYLYLSPEHTRFEVAS
ncbi:hypothetical protein GHK92_12705 [Nocardioides sp. dk4132]|uniref:hypothetical protein n=1 Tax=unclassified Nocardioides TaxID=2615069 RepID=UPI001294B420|nr:MULTISPECIES: hypothetical protein [unclassified Nocardioides]MQW76738.1 hypothetical protein [Nocardioides sp. dk4132]QGA06905.1 hypothetical protein GFH29_05515 [Nocardioides sp. dk884]